MEILLIIAVVSLIILIVLLIIVLVAVYKFFQDLRFLMTTLHHEADKVAVDIGELRSKISRKGTWLALGLGLLGKRSAVKKIAEAFVKSR